MVGRKNNNCSNVARVNPVLELQLLSHGSLSGPNPSSNQQKIPKSLIVIEIA